MFQPQFIDGVFGLAANGVKFDVTPMYCLSKHSAIELAKLIGNPNIVDGSPIPNWGNRFHYSQVVSFFKFSDGKVRNAGVLAQYWVWFNASQAITACMADIADDYMGSELI